MSEMCFVEQCSGTVVAHGLCNRHYLRNRRHGNPNGGATGKGDVHKFYDDVVLKHKGPECLIWPFSLAGNGYPQMKRDGRQIKVHRLVCKAANGPPPHGKYDAAHSCGNSRCVNPGHLSWKTRKENEQDKVAHGTKACGERHGMSKLAAALKKNDAVIAILREALEECEEHFDNRADADCDQDGYIPNEEMKLLQVVREALKKAGA